MSDISVYEVGESQEMANKRFEHFKNELAALLTKYGADLYMTADESTDWYGVVGERFEVQLRGDYRNNNVFVLSYNMGVCSADLL